MPIGLQKISLNSWFHTPSTIFGKSIQRSYGFMAEFLDNPFTPRRSDLGPMPIIQNFHFLSITLPEYKFTKENIIFGQTPVSFPVLNVEDLAQLTVSVELEEDEFGSIAFFISWLQRSIIDSSGYYVPPLKNRIGHLLCEISDPNGLPILYYTMRDLYYLNASDVVYSYDSSDSIKRNITFGCDRIETLFTKYTAINAAQKGITSLLSPLAKATGLANLV